MLGDPMADDVRVTGEVKVSNNGRTCSAEAYLNGKRCQVTMEFGNGFTVFILRDERGRVLKHMKHEGENIYKYV